MWVSKLRIFPARDISCHNGSEDLEYFPFGKEMPVRSLNPEDVGHIVRSTRKACRMRQDELAGAAGVGLRFIVELEGGKPTVQLGKTLQVLFALGCSVEITPPLEPLGGRRP